MTTWLLDTVLTYLNVILITIGCCAGLYFLIVFVPQGRKEDLIGDQIADRIRVQWEDDDAA